MTDDRDLERLLGELAEDGRGQSDPAEHPSDGTLSFYHARKLSPEEEDRVRDHLVECKRCRDLLLEYAEFMEEDEEEKKREGVADFGAAADWQRLRGRMGEEEQAPQVAAARGPLHRFFGSAKTAYSVAATLGLALIGLALYTTSLRQEMNQPDLNPTWLELSGSTRSVEGSGEVIVVPAGEEKTLVFDLPVPEEESQGEYRLEIYFDGKRIFGPRELGRQNEDDDFFTITWKSSGLKSGRYELRVFREGNLKPVGQYTFVISKQ